MLFDCKYKDEVIHSKMVKRFMNGGFDFMNGRKY